MLVTLNFTCKYCIDFAPEYVFTTKHNLCVNIKTGRIVKQVLKNGSIGYCINSKFYSLTRLRQSLVKIEKLDCPF